jgi:hypothetical protein
MNTSFHLLYSALPAGGCSRSAGVLTLTRLGPSRHLGAEVARWRQINAGEAPALRRASSASTHTVVVTRDSLPVPASHRIPCPHRQFGCTFAGILSSTRAHLCDCPFEAMKTMVHRNEQRMRKLEGACSPQLGVRPSRVLASPSSVLASTQRFSRRRGACRARHDGRAGGGERLAAQRARGAAARAGASQPRGEAARARDVQAAGAARGGPRL